MRRGQISIEYVSTYSWSLLAVTVIIGAIIYFGVLEPERFVPEECRFPSGLHCIDYQADTSGIVIVIENSLGFNIINMGVNINGSNCVTNATGPASLLNGAQGTYSFTCTPLRGKFMGLLDVTYTSQPTLQPHRKHGAITVSVA